MDYVIWSYEHRQWWGPGRCGYTPDLNHAGLYACAEAGDIVTSSWLMENLAVPARHAEINGPPRWHPYDRALEREATWDR